MSRIRTGRTAAAAAAALAVAIAGAATTHATTEPPAGTEPAGSTEPVAPPAELPESLVFAAVPSEDAGDIEDTLRNVFEVFTEDTGIEFELVLSTTYASVIEGLRNGDVDVAIMGPFSYVIAENQEVDLDVLVGEVNAEGAEAGYQSYGIALADNDEINSIEDFAGHNICFVDPASTSGYLYPYAGLLDAGIDPNEDIEAIYAGAHDTSVAGVVSGQCDAGFAFDTMVTIEAIEAGIIEEGDVKVVWESSLIPATPFAVRADMPEDLRNYLAAEFVKIDVDYLVERGVCDGQATCLPNGIWGYARIEDSDFDVIRTICEETQAESCTTQ